MDTHYTDEANVQILIALMKHHGICRVVASPGTTNITFVASIQQDPYFTLYSSVDERSAAYMACGLASETGEPVALSCTGATASRNYMPGLTEAFYRKLPVLAVTSTQHLGRIGHGIAQVIDRRTPLNDIVRMSVQCPSVESHDDRWACEMALNRALLELTHHGGGPVHVNLVTTYSENFGVKELPKVRCVNRIALGDEMPSLDGKRVAVFVGAHAAWDERLTAAVDAFCEAYGAAVVCDHTSNYRGPYRALGALACSQDGAMPSCRKIDVLVHIGEVSGVYYGFEQGETWRVSLDGEVKDPINNLRYVFEMREDQFFNAYLSRTKSDPIADLASEWQQTDARIRTRIPELPFSNPWLAQQTAHRLPEGSVLHLGILNSLRSWNFFETPETVRCYSDTGGFGIDGCVSALIGASLADASKLYFGVVGDLAMFYDLNSLGNRHVGSNVRLIVVNNGVGTEFKNYNHKAARFGEDADAFMAARGHYGAQSRDLLRHYATDLGFEYLSAEDKEGYLSVLDRFVDPAPHDRPMLLEVFTSSVDESDAIKALHSIETDARGAAKNAVKSILGDKGIKAAKKILGR
ncbi:uncharacterized protein BN642_00643 [Collinsella sp. CAG:398]|nr:uncharacterized protein BN642_00643 [Collinsella sp. CAG:398]